MKALFNNAKINQSVNKLANIIATNLNVSKVICNHLIDEKHTDRHRCFAGVFIMVIGVSISKIHVAYIAVHFLLDGVGYAIHGIGLIPFVDALSKIAHKDEKKESDENKTE